MAGKDSTNPNFKDTMQALFEGMNGFVASKTVVGDAIHVGDTILLPLVDVSFAMGAGSLDGDSRNRGSGGLGGKVSPTAILVIQNGTTKLISVKNNDAVNKIIDYVPDVVNRFTGGKNAFVDRDIDKAVEKAFEEMDGASESE